MHAHTCIRTLNLPYVYACHGKLEALSRFCHFLLYGVIHTYEVVSCFFIILHDDLAGKDNMWQENGGNA